jgi:hypothetical protein
MMVGTLGQPPRGDLGPGRLVVLGLFVSMVSFAGFRLTTDTKPADASFVVPESVVTASVPSPIPSILFPRLTTSDPVLGQTRTEPTAVEQAPAAGEVATLAMRPPMDVAESLSEVPEFRDVEHRFAAGETFAEVLGENGVSNTAAAAWIKAASRIYALSQIRDGQKL